MADFDDIEVNLDEVDDAFELFPDKTAFPVRVKMAKVVPPKDGKEWPNIEVRLQPTQEEYVKRTLFMNLPWHPDGRGIMKRFCKDLGLPMRGTLKDIAEGINSFDSIFTCNVGTKNERNTVSGPYIKL